MGSFWVDWRRDDPEYFPRTCNENFMKEKWGVAPLPRTTSSRRNVRWVSMGHIELPSVLLYQSHFGLLLPSP